MLAPRTPRLPRILIVLAVVAAAFVPVSAAGPAAAQANPSLPLGTVTPVEAADPQCAKAGAERCVAFEITACPQIPALRGYYAVRDRKPGTPAKGTIVFFSGGGGEFYFASEPVGGRKPNGAKYLLQALHDAGFMTIQVRWHHAWEDAGPGEQPGARVACRPATIVDHLHRVEYGKPQAARGVGICGFCITGSSGGSAQVGYTLSHFGLDTSVDGVFPVSGPTHAAIVKGCAGERLWEPYWFKGVSTRRIDAMFGFTQPNGPFAEAEGPCKNREAESWTERWRLAAIDTGALDSRHDRTRVHVFMGENDSVLRNHAGDYLRNLVAAGSPFVGQQVIAGMGHGITSFTSGADGDELADFPGLVAMFDAFALRREAKLPACNNGLDDDWDGTADSGGVGSLPADGGCTGPTDSAEWESGGATCDNGSDDDGDGRFDYALDNRDSDPGCTDRADSDERGPFACDSGTDEDGDGRVDFPADLGCVNPQDTNETDNNLACDDGIDNADGDGKADYDDPDCTSAWSDGKSELPNIRIADASGPESTSPMRFVVSITSAPSASVVVRYTTANASAVAPEDYATKTREITLTNGSNKNIPIAIKNDQLDELDEERFRVTLSIVSGAAHLADPGAFGYLQDDDLPPTVSITGGSAPEGNKGLTNSVPFTVTLSKPSGRAVSVGYSTADGVGPTGALAASDYVATAGSVTFAAGETSTTLTVPIRGDTVGEPDETFSTTLSSPVGAVLASSASATGTILDDDGAGGGGTTISVNDATVTEPDAGTNTRARFTISLSTPATQTVTVKFATADGSAKAGSDYKAKSGTVTFEAGQSSKAVAVVVLGDNVAERNEIFYVNLSAPTGATISDGQGMGRIQNDD